MLFQQKHPPLESPDISTSNKIPDTYNKFSDMKNEKGLKKYVKDLKLK